MSARQRREAVDYDRPLRIEERDTTVIAGSTGQEKDRGWITATKARGRLVPLRASERFVADQIDARVLVRYELAHYFGAVTNEMRVVDEQDGVTYQITGITPALTRRGGQILDCDRFTD